MDVLLWILFGVLPAIAAVLFGVGVGGPRWLALALAVAVCVPFGMADGWPAWLWQLDLQGGEPRPLLWWLLLLGGLLGSLYDLRWLPRVMALALEVGLVALLPWILSAPLRRAGTFEWGLLYLGGGWAVMALLWWSLRRAARAQPGLVVPLAMTLALGADAVLLRANAGGADWQLAGVAAVALGFAVLTTIWRRPFECGAGAALCMTLLHTGLLLCGRAERELVQLPFVVAWLAPAAIAVVAAPWFVRARRTGACVGVLAVGGCAGFVVWSTLGR